MKKVLSIAVLIALCITSGAYAVTFELTNHSHDRIFIKTTDNTSNPEPFRNTPLYIGPPPRYTTLVEIEPGQTIITNIPTVELQLDIHATSNLRHKTVEYKYQYDTQNSKNKDKFLIFDNAKHP